VGSILVLFLFPLTASAEVLISEIAWMGDSRSANYEWIELTNTGNDTVDVTSWDVSAVDGSPDISLKGVIAANGTFLLERTSDESLQGFSADIIYSGSLSNTGELLNLKDSSSNTVDTVDGSSKWAAIGGDNDTKHTAQRTDDGWITAKPTPRSSELTMADDATADTTNTQATTSTTNINTITQYKYTSVTIQPPEDVYIRVPETLTTTVGAFTEFNLESYDATGSVVGDGNVYWAFGDGSEASGRNVVHRFLYEGEYMVHVSLVRGALTDEQLITVTVVPLEVSVVVGEGGVWVTVHNKSTLPLDISNWRFTTDYQYFTIPDGTIVGAEKEVKFPTEVTKLTSLSHDTHVVLRYPNNDIAYDTSSAAVEEIAETQETGFLDSPNEEMQTTSLNEPKKEQRQIGIIGSPVRVSREIVNTQESKTKEVAYEESVVHDSFATSAQAAATILGAPEDSGQNNVYWYLGLGAMLLLGVISVLLIGPQKLVVEGFEVTEEKE